MQIVASVTKNHNTSLLKDPAEPTAKARSCRQKSNCPLAEKCLLECLVYHALVAKFIMVPVKITTKNVTTTIQLLLEIKVKKKVQNSKNLSGSWKIIA